MTWVRVALCWALVAGGQAAAVPEAKTEFAIKADFLVNLLPYIQWPDQAERLGRPFQIVVLGRSPFGPHLDSVVRTQTVHRRPIQVRYLTRLGDLEGCEAIFICRSESSRLEAVLAWAQARNVLTMADEEAFARKGVMLNLLMEGTSIKPTFNQQTTALAGIQVNPRVFRFVRPFGPSPAPSPVSRGGSST
jgi:hypothetical protein